jgi:light-regulated signal transduction histidine kinase (bacteriophytochrome)
MTEPDIAPYRNEYDLSNCDVEPIQFIRHYQKHGFLLVVERGHLIVKAHAGDFLGLHTADTVVGKTLAEVLGEEAASLIGQVLAKEDYQAHNPLAVDLAQSTVVNAGLLNLIMNPSGEDVLLEFEPREEKVSGSSFLFRIDQALSYIQNSGFTDKLFSSVVKKVKSLTEYDRVMLYRFDAEFNGEVVAEARNEDLEPFLHLRYPHTDIPEQARALFLINSVRHIVDTSPQEVSVIHSHPKAGELDLTHSVNRGSSPIHLRYLSNMRVGASLVVALVVNQKLWGLISCHHNTPKLVDFRLRSVISLMGKVLSGHLALQEAADFRNRILASSVSRSKIFERMSERFNIVEGLLNPDSPTLPELTSAVGAAVLFDGEIHQIGQTPSTSEITAIVDHLGTRAESLFATERFFDELPAARNFENPPAGLLSIRLTRQPAEYILWFRPEIRKTVLWGGNPNLRKQIKKGKVDIHPELSFKKWAEQMEGISEAWEAHHFDAASGLRNDIKEVILQKYQEARRLNGQLVEAYEELETFSYSVSHDLRAPLNNIKGFAQVLQEDYGAQLDDFGQEALRTIVTSVGRMNSFINDMLDFSRLSQQETKLLEVELDKVIDEVLSDLNYQTKNAQFSRKGGGVVLQGDFIQLKQLVQNILSNAFKYSSKVAQPEIILESGTENGTVFFRVTDNGIGMDMKKAGNIFTVFNRLVSKDEYEGSGIGLSIAHRIIEKHNGTINVDSEPGRGTTFTVVLPAGINSPT